MKVCEDDIESPEENFRFILEDDIPIGFDWFRFRMVSLVKFRKWSEEKFRRFSEVKFRRFSVGAPVPGRTDSTSDPFSLTIF